MAQLATLSDFEKAHIKEIIDDLRGEKYDSFGAQLLRLIAKADADSYWRLRVAFPAVVEAYAALVMAKVETHDFGLGDGEVPAHRHPNGGGWVADSATVAPTARVGEHASVSGHAIVSGYAVIGEQAIVSGHASVGEQAIVSGHAIVGGRAIVSGRAIVTSRRE